MPPACARAIPRQHAKPNAARRARVTVRALRASSRTRAAATAAPHPPGSPPLARRGRETGSGPPRTRAGSGASRRSSGSNPSNRNARPASASERIPNTNVAPSRFSSDSRSPTSASVTSCVEMIGTASSERPMRCSEASSCRPTGSLSRRHPSSKEKSFRRPRSDPSRCIANIAISRTICSPTRSACEYSARLRPVLRARAGRGSAGR